MIQISTQAFREAAAKLQAIGSAFESEKFEQVLLGAVEPIKQGVIANVHSVTGKTVSAVESGLGHGALPSAYVKVDKKIAYVMWRGRPYPYPYAVEAGHGTVSAHPFFRKAVDDNRAAVRRLVNEGSREVLNPYIGTSQVGGEFA